MSADPLPAPDPDLRASGLRLAYDNRLVVDGLDLAIPPGRIKAVVGANACGESTLLRALARLLAPREGAVRLDGRDLRSIPARELARRLGILPQSPAAPDGLTVIDLVGRGRSPHQTWWRQWSGADEQAVRRALAATGMTDLADRPLDELSRGQRQRAWIVMTVAQDTAMLLLDEPTTYLDLAHQIDVLDLVTDLNRRERRTVVDRHGRPDRPGRRARPGQGSGRHHRVERRLQGRHRHLGPGRTGQRGNTDRTQGNRHGAADGEDRRAPAGPHPRGLQRPRQGALPDPVEVRAVVAQPKEYNDFGVPWQRQTEIIGTALGQKAKAKELVKGVRAKFRTVAAGSAPTC